MVAYYNEIDPYASQWLRNLIDAGHIAKGDVDTRSIKDVSADDLKGYTQCHFFAGIGVWSHALRRAKWADDRPVWTGSCPCQPFSAAGTQKGTTDDRHLWPIWFNLIRECRPRVIFGEQVEAAINHGWLDLVQSDLERENYACGAVGIPAAGVGAPHIRQRLWFVANTGGVRSNRRSEGHYGTDPQQSPITSVKVEGSSTVSQLANATNNGYLATDGLRETVESSGEAGTHGVGQLAGSCDVSQLADAESLGRQYQSSICGSNGALEKPPQRRIGIGGESRIGGVDDTKSVRPGLQHSANIRQADAQVHIPADPGDCESDRSSRQRLAADRPDPTNGHWRDADWLHCRDGKWRPVEPGAFPLAHGATARVGRLRAYGNAIVPQAAQAFIEAYLET